MDDPMEALRLWAEQKRAVLGNAADDPIEALRLWQLRARLGIPTDADPSEALRLFEAHCDEEYRKDCAEHSPECDGDDEEAEPVRPKRQRKPTLLGVIRQMKRAGLEIARCVVNRDGVDVIVGKPSGEIGDDRNEWDTVQ
jgi:hypothetical protein